MENESRKNTLFQRHPVKTIISTLILLFLFFELVLRGIFFVKGYPVGSLIPNWYGLEIVDSLELNKQFYTDTQGMYKAYPPYWEDYRYQLNRDHFRSREFIIDTNSKEQRVLLIGDSFTWGSHAEPIHNCFADLLDADTNFVTYNAGIPGTDPAQYLLVAETYVPKLKPHFTIVNFYLANDIMEDYREIKPNEDLYYQTNAGWLPASYKEHIFKDHREAYDYVLYTYTIHGWFAKLISKTAIGTAILAFPIKLEEYLSWNKKKKSSVPNNYLKKMDSFCQKHDSQLLIFVIPSSYADLQEKAYQKDAKKYVLEAYPNLFTGLEEKTYILPMQPEHYYEMPDGHFNNEGHRVAALFMKKNILEF